jgi:hypothetical protein
MAAPFWICTDRAKKVRCQIAGLAIGRIDEGMKRRGNNILRGQPGAKTRPLFVPGEQKESAFHRRRWVLFALNGDPPSDRVAPTHEAANDGCE